jgi:hypothetical protein
MSQLSPQFPPQPAPELLAGYVLGDLTESEIAVVEAYLTAHPDRQREILSLMMPLDLLSLTLPPDNPPPSLRQQILQAAAETVVNQPAVPAAAPIRSKVPSWRSILTGLGLLLVTGLGWHNYRLSAELATVKQDLKIAQTANTSQSNRDPLSVISLLQEPNNRFIPLKNMSGKQGMGMGSLMMVPNKSAAVLALQQIKPLPPGQVYRMWAIMGDAEMNCADFLPDAQGKVSMQIPLNRWEKAKKVMITIEQKQAKEAEGEITIEGEI